VRLLRAAHEDPTSIIRLFAGPAVHCPAQSARSVKPRRQTHPPGITGRTRPDCPPQHNASATVTCRTTGTHEMLYATPVPIATSEPQPTRVMSFSFYGSRLQKASTEIEPPAPPACRSPGATQTQNGPTDPERPARHRTPLLTRLPRDLHPAEAILKPTSSSANAIRANAPTPCVCPQEETPARLRAP